MKKRNIRVLVCVVMLFIAVALAACANEAEALQARIEELETENAGLQSTISSMRTDLERAQADLTNARHELQYLISAQEAAAQEQAASGTQSGPLAITYGGEPNQDMSWPLDYGDLPLSLRMNPNELDGEAEIVWHSTNESVFSVVVSEDGLSAIVTPLSTGSAQLVVTVGSQETRSWVRIT